MVWLQPQAACRSRSVAEEQQDEDQEENEHKVATEQSAATAKKALTLHEAHLQGMICVTWYARRMKG